MNTSIQTYALYIRTHNIVHTYRYLHYIYVHTNIQTSALSHVHLHHPKICHDGASTQYLLDKAKIAGFFFY